MKRPKLAEDSRIVLRFWWLWYRVSGVLWLATRRQEKRDHAELRVALRHLHPDDVDHWIKLRARKRLSDQIEEGSKDE